MIHQHQIYYYYTHIDIVVDHIYDKSLSTLFKKYICFFFKKKIKTKKLFVLTAKHSSQG